MGRDRRHERQPATGRRPPRWPTGRNRREQVRLLLLTFLLMTVISLMFEARDPRRWQWLWEWSRSTPPSDTAAGDPKVAPNPPQPRAELERMDPETPLAESGQHLGIAWSDQAPVVSELPWDLVQDNTVFRAEEHDAWFGTLRALAETDPSTMAAANPPLLTPIHLMQQTSAYRGQLVRVEGRMRRAHHVPAAKNTDGIDGYWQLWFQTSAESDIPVVVYALSYPEHAARGMSIDEPATVTGVLFKRWTYLAADGIRAAPLLLARGVDVSRQPPAAGPATQPAERFSLPEMMLLAAVGVASLWCSLRLFLWIGRRDTSRDELPPRIEIPEPVEDQT